MSLFELHVNFGHYNTYGDQQTDRAQNDTVYVRIYTTAVASGCIAHLIDPTCAFLETVLTWRKSMLNSSLPFLSLLCQTAFISA